MRAFVMVEPKFFTLPEIFPTLLEGFVAWREANREHMESFEFFAGGGGGFGIFNGPDEATLNGIMVQYPFFPYSQITVRPLLQRYAVVLDLGLIGCLVQYRGCRGPLLII